MRGPHSQADSKAAWGSRDAHVQSTATRRPRPQADGARGAPRLPLRFSAKPSLSVPWARGLLSAFWERGSPDLPAYGLRRSSSGGPVRPIFVSTRLETLTRGQASRGGRHKASLKAASPGRLTRRQRDQGRIPREVLVTQAMTIEIRRVPTCAVSLFPLWCKGGKHRHGVPRHQTKVAISVQQDQDQQSGRMEVTVEPKTV